MAIIDINNPYDQLNYLRNYPTNIILGIVCHALFAVVHLNYVALFLAFLIL